MRKHLLCLPLALCLTPLVIMASDSPADTTTASDNTADAPSPAPSPDGSQAAPAVETPLSRWLTLNTLSFSYRWRDQADNDGFHIFDTGQERALIDGRLKLDKEGKYSVNFHVSTGRYFTWAYADSIGQGFGETAALSLYHFSPAQMDRFFAALEADPAGVDSVHIASRGWELFVRELYFSATPVKQLSLEYGGLGFERGASSEITSYDEDGYLVGERVRLRDPKHLYFDQVAVTIGYVGDYFSPNLFTRGDRFEQANYGQLLLEKDFGHRLKASADYTYQNSVNTAREAVFVKVPETHFLDTARLELYQRTNTVTFQGETYGTAAGFAFTGSKTLVKKFQLEGGYASIDQNYSILTGSRFLNSVAFSLNGDSWGIGPRFFTRANYRINPFVSFFGYYSHQLAVDYYTLNRQGMNFGMTIDFKSLLSSQKLHVL